MINRMATVRFQREQGGAWELGIAFDGERGFVVSLAGEVLQQVWDMRDTGALTMDIGSILRRLDDYDAPAPRGWYQV